MASTVFANRLTTSDWDDTQRAWRCPALGIPGAAVQDLVINGARVDKAQYQVLLEQRLIRWVLPDTPDKVAAIIELTQPLSLVSDTDRWKKLAIMLPVVATILAAAISGSVAYLNAHQDSQTPIQPLANASITSDTEFNLGMPRGDKVCLEWKGAPTDGSAALKKAGISLVDYHEGTKIAYAALTNRDPDSIEYIPFFGSDGKALPGLCESVLAPGPNPKSSFQEFQLFDIGREFIVMFHPLDQSAPIAPGKIGIDWDKVKKGLGIALKAIHKGTEYEFGGISTLTDPNGHWEYRISYHPT